MHFLGTFPQREWNHQRASVEIIMKIFGMFCWARDKESVAANTQNSIITTSVCREQLQQVNTTESNTTPQQNQANRQQINSSRALTSMQFWSMIEIDSRVFERNLGKIRFTRKITRKRHIFLLTFWQFHRFREGLIPPLLFQIKCLVWSNERTARCSY